MFAQVNPLTLEAGEQVCESANLITVIRRLLVTASVVIGLCIGAAAPALGQVPTHARSAAVQAKTCLWC